VPELVAGLRVERLHVIAERMHVDDAVVHERCCRVRPRRQRQRPRELEICDVVLVDLRERRKAEPIVRAPPSQPIAGRRVREHLVGDDRRSG